MSSFSASCLYRYFTFSLHFISWDIIKSPVWQTECCCRRYCLFGLYACLWFNSLYYFSTLRPLQTNSCVAPSLPPPALPHCPHPSLHPKPPTSLVSPPSSFNLTLLPLIMSTPHPCNPLPPPSHPSFIVDVLCVLHPPPSFSPSSLLTAITQLVEVRPLTDNIKLALRLQLHHMIWSTNQIWINTKAFILLESTTNRVLISQDKVVNVVWTWLIRNSCALIKPQLEIFR